MVALAGEGGDAGGADGLAEAAAQVPAALALLPGPGGDRTGGTDGHSPAQDTRWAAAGNRVRSRPVPAMTARAKSSLTPGISASRATVFSVKAADD